MSILTCAVNCWPVISEYLDIAPEVLGGCFGTGYDTFKKMFFWISLQIWGHRLFKTASDSKNSVISVILFTLKWHIKKSVILGNAQIPNNKNYGNSVILSNVKLRNSIKKYRKNTGWVRNVNYTYRIFDHLAVSCIHVTRNLELVLSIVNLWYPDIAGMWCCLC